MLKPLTQATTLNLKLYYTDDVEEYEATAAKGIPVILWHNIYPGQPEKEEEACLRWLLFPILKKKFPKIDFYKMWGRPPYLASLNFNYGKTLSSGGEYGACDGGVMSNVKDSLLDKQGWQIDVEALAQLNLMPKFLGEIAHCITRNLATYHWKQGYDKKRKTSVMGVYEEKEEEAVLLILDVSNSVPKGISDALLALADTLRHQVNADLIITGARTYRWSMSDELPSPQKLREMIPACNESTMYWDIIKEHYAGKRIGTVIVFGDYDSPSGSRGLGRYFNARYAEGKQPYELHWDALSDWGAKEVLKRMENTQVEHMICFWIRQGRDDWSVKCCPGYGTPFLPYTKSIEIDNTWTTYIED